MPQTQTKSWQDIKSTYDQHTKGQLQAIRDFFGSDQPPTSLSDSDIRQLMSVDEQFAQCVQSLYKALPQSAQTATNMGYKSGRSADQDRGRTS